MREGAAGSSYWLEYRDRTFPADAQLYVRQGSYELYLAPQSRELLIGISDKYARPLHLSKKSLEIILRDLSQAQLNLFRPEVVEENHYSPSDEPYRHTPGWNMYVESDKVIIVKDLFNPGLLHLSGGDLAELLERLA